MTTDIGMNRFGYRVLGIRGGSRHDIGRSSNGGGGGG